MTAIHLPPVTDDHRRKAFSVLRFPGWTFEAAMQNDTRRRVIEALAAHVRTREWQQTHAKVTRLVRRLDPQALTWHTQRVRGGWSDSTTLIGDNS